MPAALTPPWNVQTPMREPAVIRENASATATAYRSSRIISIGTPSRPSALFTRQTGKVETQATPSCLRMRLMLVATSIVMDVASFVWSRVVRLRVGEVRKMTGSCRYGKTWGIGGRQEHNRFSRCRHHGRTVHPMHYDRR